MVLATFAAVGQAAAADPGVPGGTCTVAFGTVPYGSTNNLHIIAAGSAEQVACDPRYPAADSGVAPPNSGTSAGGGTWSAVTNEFDDTLIYAPHARWVGPDTYTMYFCNDVNCTGVGRVTATVNVTVSAPTLSLTTSLPNGTVATAYSQVLTASGSASPYAFSVLSGTLPTGLSLGVVSNPTGSSSTVTLSGTPTVAGTFSFTIRAADNSIGQPGQFPLVKDQGYTVTIAPIAPVANAVSATVAYSSTGNPITLNITGGTAASVAVAGAASHGTATASGASITYTPTAGYAGPDSFTYTATNSAGTSAPATVTITVSPPTFALNPPGLPDGTTGIFYSQTVTATGGTLPYTFSILSATPPPAGLSIHPTTGVISGTPTGTGTTTFTVVVQDSSTGPSFPFGAARAYTMTILTPNPPVANAVSTTVAYNSSANSVTLNITGGAPTSVAVASAASNGTATASGTSITYTPTAGYFGSDSFTYTATNADGTSAPATVTVTVNPQPPIAGAGSLTAAFNSSANPVTLNITGGTPVSVAVASAAANGTATASGTSITYTPTAGYFGPDSFTYTATNAGGTSAPAMITITVNNILPIANGVSATLPFNSVNAPITLNITGGAAISVAVATPASNGTATASGTTITYTPTTNYAGPDSFTYTATNSAGTSAPAPVTITVNPPPPPIANAVSATLPANSVNVPIALNITGAALSLATPTLPTHGTLSVSGLSITYTPTAGYSGPDSFTYRATNPGGTSATATATIIVSPPTLTLSAIPTTGEATTAYSATITASLGTSPYSFAVTAGALPTSVSLSSGGVLSGTPTVIGPFTFTVTATDVYGATGSQAYTVTISAPTVTITSPTAGALPAATGGTAYSQTFTASGGAGGHSFAMIAGALPAGMSFTSAGILSGTPTVSGTFNFNIRASDSSPGPSGPFNSAAVSYTLTVNAPGITVSPASLPAATTALAYSETVTASGGTGPYSFGISAGGLPAGMSFTAAGLLSGTPTAAGTHNFTVTATDTHGFTGDQAYTIVVSDPVITLDSPAAGGDRRHRLQPDLHRQRWSGRPQLRHDRRSAASRHELHQRRRAVRHADCGGDVQLQYPGKRRQPWTGGTVQQHASLLHAHGQCSDHHRQPDQPASGDHGSGLQPDGDRQRRDGPLQLQHHRRVAAGRHELQQRRLAERYADGGWNLQLHRYRH